MSLATHILYNLLIVMWPRLLRIQLSSQLFIYYDKVFVQYQAIEFCMETQHFLYTQSSVDLRFQPYLVYQISNRVS